MPAVVHTIIPQAINANVRVVVHLQNITIAALKRPFVNSNGLLHDAEVAIVAVQPPAVEHLDIESGLPRQGNPRLG